MALKKAKTGRPPFKITKAICNQAGELAAQGLTLEQIARSLGICYDTLNVKRKAFPELAVAIKKGQADGIAKVTNALFEKACNGDNVAMIFYLKNRDPDNWNAENKTALTVSNHIGSMSDAELERIAKSGG